ncbi:hypothetical protein F5888DRAFT_1858186 [Russula emetica]|nr:hypothetical protein F5888DRAFT_1858186 [Russula emetica]
MKLPHLQDTYKIARTDVLASSADGTPLSSSNTTGSGSGSGSASSARNAPERRDSYHHHRASHSLMGSPLPEEFPRQRHEPTYSGSSTSPSLAGSSSSIADFRDRMNDIGTERQQERERAWNRPPSARSRTLSHTGSAGHSPSPRRGSDQSRSTSNSAPRSREDSRAPSPSESVRSRATEEGEENHEHERNWGSSRPRWDHQYRQPTSPTLGSSVLRPRMQSTHSNGSDRRLRHTPSQSSLHSEGSSRPSSPADQTHRRKDEDEEVIHEREPTSPNPTTSHSRVRTNSEPDPSAPAGSALTRPANGLLKGRPAEQHLSSHHSASPPEAPERAERDETSRYPMSTSPQPKPTNGHPHDKPLRMPSRHPRPDSPLPPSTGNSADVKSASPGSATRFGWQFPRNRPQLPDFEPDTSSPERSPSHVHRSTSQAKRRCTKGHKRATTEFSEANGAVPPKIHLHEPEFASESESMDATSLQGSDDGIQDAHIQDVPTPIARPIEIPPPEKLQSFSPIRTASAAEDPDSDASSPPGRDSY